MSALARSQARQRERQAKTTLAPHETYGESYIKPSLREKSPSTRKVDSMLNEFVTNFRPILDDGAISQRSYGQWKAPAEQREQNLPSNSSSPDRSPPTLQVTIPKTYSPPPVLMEVKRKQVPRPTPVYVPFPSVALPQIAINPDKGVTARDEFKHRANRRAPPIAFYNSALRRDPSIMKSAIHAEKPMIKGPIIIATPSKHGAPAFVPVRPATSEGPTKPLPPVPTAVRPRTTESKASTDPRLFVGHELYVNRAYAVNTPRSAIKKPVFDASEPFQSVFEDWSSDEEDGGSALTRFASKRKNSVTRAVKRAGGWFERLSFVSFGRK